MTLLTIRPSAQVRARFAPSPLAETVATLVLVGDPTPPAGGRDWLERHADALGEITADRTTYALVCVLAASVRPPGFLLSVPPMSGATFDDELAAVEATPLMRARRDLLRATGIGLPPVLEGDDVVPRIADALRMVWNRLTRHDWERREAAFTHDTAQRAGRLDAHGWTRALAGLGPAVRWLGENRLHVAQREPVHAEVRDAELVLVPCGLGVSWYGVHTSGTHTITYPTRVADAPGGDGLDRLVGATRAKILRTLRDPTTTSQLAAQLGYSLATVSAHLSALTGARLATSERDGRSVRYWRTQLGDALVEAQST
ncbi:ArsR family transcriptional regulator [Herbihabitans rhizosphaerae]|uniref:ArsR family transcriptional regulator n=1 Tax=Herbihabitans rhizosphaerae TaxID=1872711 RepID=A0A4Q7KCA1_9PSEU|nr:helix-turn-helix domain-containing protein [Herbihabitans rhizosphaerae]RZS30323.1 ArsR family transcriptional regulator [Herbihabitans rhizosphaerae]